jgi:nicotinate-nucleotide--dimethylbenzimidazole phosphoribosyltransferase
MKDHESIRRLCERVPPLDTSAAAAAQTRLDRLTKPPGSLGRLEALMVQLAAMRGAACPTLRYPAVLVAAGDHGVAQEGVSPYPQVVTSQMVLNFLAGGAAINALAAQTGARVIVVDAGVATELPPHPQLRRLGLRQGTRNLRRTAALTRDEAAAAVLAGAALLDEEARVGLDLLALGEMGIGNTTVAACLTSVFAAAPPEQTVGRGTGLDEAGVAYKRAVVADALARAQADPADPLGVLAELGGLEIACLVGVALAAAAQRIPLLLDGYVATSAALVAVGRSSEPGHRIALEILGLRPLLELDMRLGEGSGAALALPLVLAATRVLRDMATFDDAGVSDRAS